MVIHHESPEDYSEMVTVNLFGVLEYVMARKLEEAGVTEVWFHDLNGVEVVSYKRNSQGE